MKIKPPIEGVVGTVPPHMRDAEENALIESGEIDAWIAELEAGETPKATPVAAEWSTVQEVAARHRLSSKTIRRAIHDGKLKATEHGRGRDPRQRRYRIHRDDEAAWIAGKGEHKREAATRAPRSSTGRSFKELVER